MKIKTLIICGIVLTCTLMSCKIDNNKLINEVNIQKEKPKEIIIEEVDKTEEEKQLEYWSDVTGKEVTKVTEIDCSLTFYTDLSVENGGYANLTASGKELNSKTIANNYYNFDQEIYIEGYGLKVLQDRGGSGFDNWNAFDIHVPRIKGESTNEYYQRVKTLGRDYQKGYVLEYK